MDRSIDSSLGQDEDQIDCILPLILPVEVTRSVDILSLGQQRGTRFADLYVGQNIQKQSAQWGIPSHHT